MSKKKQGHLLAVITVCIWGTTYISTQVLLSELTPLNIQLFRATIALILLIIFRPKFSKPQSMKRELLFAAAGLFGITLYFLFENSALYYTSATNVGLIVAIAPMLTAIFAHFMLKEEPFKKEFFLGCILAFFGVFLTTANKLVLKINPIGDILAIISTTCWSFYNILVKKLPTNINDIEKTRKIFFYGIIGVLIAMLVAQEPIALSALKKPLLLKNLLFLSVGGSALAFVMWNRAVKILGATKTTNYLYLVPAVTIVASIIVLKEVPAIATMIGAVFIILGVYISQNGFKRPFRASAVLNTIAIEEDKQKVQNKESATEEAGY